MFYLIEFDDIDTDNTKQLQYELSGYPNGTILSCSQRIRISHLPRDKWVVWIDRHIVNRYPEQYDSFAKIKGIKRFIELDIKKTPNDVDWVWDDHYIDHLFMDVV